MTLRHIAEGIKSYIEGDAVLHDSANVTVVVEDKTDIGYEIAKALGQTGVCVLIAVTDFTRVDGSPLLQGDVRLQITCFEHPSLNRDDSGTLTAQGVSERLAQILHYTTFDFLVGQIIFENFSRDDTEEANIVRGNYRAQVSLEVPPEQTDKE